MDISEPYFYFPSPTFLNTVVAPSRPRYPSHLPHPHPAFPPSFPFPHGSYHRTVITAFLTRSSVLSRYFSGKPASAVGTPPRWLSPYDPESSFVEAVPSAVLFVVPCLRPLRRGSFDCGAFGAAGAVDAAGVDGRFGRRVRPFGLWRSGLDSGAPLQ